MGCCLKVVVLIYLVCEGLTVVLTDDTDEFAAGFGVYVD